MSKFIMSKKAYEFTNPSTGECLKIPRQFVGGLPDWAAASWLFRAAVKDASITFVGDQKENVEPPSETEDEALAALRERGKALGIPYAGQMGAEKLKAAITVAEDVAPAKDGAE